MTIDAAVIERIRQELHPHLSAWSLSPATALTLLAHSENTTFRADDPEIGRSIVLRVMRPGYHDGDEVASELAWIRALREAEAIATPEPLTTECGRDVLTLPLAGEPRRIVAFAFMSGREPQPTDALEPWFRRLGAISAELHVQSRHWRRPPGFRRKRWDFDAMLGERRLWGDWRAAPGLDRPALALLERVAAQLDDRLARHGTGAERFGLVHADLRLTNLLVEGDRLGVIDFDDSGLSWFGYDFAAAVSFFEHDPIVPALQEEWLAGYRTVTRFAPEDEAMLPAFVLLRRMLLTAWIASHHETDTAKAMGVDYVGGTVAMGERFLSGQDLYR